MDAQAARDPDPQITQVEAPGFRRTRIPRAGTSLDAHGAQLAAEALEMTDDGRAVPAPDSGELLTVRVPATVHRDDEGADAEALLAAGYRNEAPSSRRAGWAG